MRTDFKTLPISEEMLGAYIEGNLSLEDMQYVDRLLQTDDEFKLFFEEINISETLDNTISIYDEYPSFENNFQLPDLMSVNATRTFQDYYSFECRELMSPSLLDSIDENTSSDALLNNSDESIIPLENMELLNDNLLGEDEFDVYNNCNINM